MLSSDVKIRTKCIILVGQYIRDISFLADIEKYDKIVRDGPFEAFVFLWRVRNTRIISLLRFCLPNVLQKDVLHPW